MKIKRIIVLIIASLLAVSLLGSCSDEPDPVEVHADPEHGRVVSVTYTCAGGKTPTAEFSYCAAEKDGDFVFTYSRYDTDGNRIEGEKTIAKEEMNALRALIEEYGYSEQVGNRPDPDFGNDEEPDAPSYYFSVSYEDGRSMSAESAGEGGYAVESFFRSLSEKSD